MASRRSSLHRYIVNRAERKSIETRSAPAFLAATLAPLPSISPIAIRSIHVFRIALLFQSPPKPPKRIKKFIHDALLQRNDPVICDLNVFGTNFRATLGDVAITDPISIPQLLNPILCIERMHL